jgi:hypothetical protein
MAPPQDSTSPKRADRHVGTTPAASTRKIAQTRRSRQPAASTDHVEGARLVATVRGYFSTTYLTLITIIQGAALGYLVIVVDARAKSFQTADWILAGTTFLFIVAAWNEYMMGATAFSWIPRLRDSLVPFSLGAAELASVRGLGSNLAGWLFSAAAVGIVAFFAFENMYRSAAKDGGNEFVLRVVQPFRGLNSAFCVGAGVVLAAFGIISLPLNRSNVWNVVFASVSALLISGFLCRASLYWKRIISSAE